MLYRGWFLKGLSPLSFTRKSGPCRNGGMSSLKQKSGFTLIELVMIIVILAFIVVVAVPAFLSIYPDTRAYFAVRKMRSDIRYAQLLAMEQVMPPPPPYYGAAFFAPPFNSPPDPPNPSWIGYQLQRGNFAGAWFPLIHPSERTSYIVKLGEKNYKDVTITAISLNGGNIVVFDVYGRPINSSGAALSEPAYVDVNNKYRLNFRAQTGKVDITTL